MVIFQKLGKINLSQKIVYIESLANGHSYPKLPLTFFLSSLNTYGQIMKKIFGPSEPSSSTQ